MQCTTKFADSLHTLKLFVVKHSENPKLRQCNIISKLSFKLQSISIYIEAA